MASCCVCLEELPAACPPLPCCGRAESSIGCCAACLLHICATTACCPACRTQGLWWDSYRGAAILGERAKEASLSSRRLAISYFILESLRQCALAILSLLLHPLGIAFEQALEAVLSRGPV